MAENVVVDALPYIDLGYDEPGVREAVSKNFMHRQTLTLQGHGEHMEVKICNLDFRPSHW